jgi:glycosyltransferase involved in cell wall biosynthesis
MSILFVDMTCPKPYNSQSLANEPLGGTEATIIRIAEGLAHKGIKVTVAQHNRLVPDYGLVNYSPFSEEDPDEYDHIIALRLPQMLMSLRFQAPKAKMYLWMHDLATPDFLQYVQGIIDTDTTMLCVSHWHKLQATEALRGIGAAGLFPIKVILNPIDNDLVPDGTPTDKHKLVYFSSPHKGLKRTLEVFTNLRRMEPKFTLHVANPGYMSDMDTSKVDGVVNHGPLSHNKVIEEVRSALCVFHLNTVFPETFGLVYAECQAVGTPFLTHSLGAVQEIYSHPAQLVDCNDTKKVIDRVMSWVDGNRPKVRGNPYFRLASVLRDWDNILRNVNI